MPPLTKRELAELATTTPAFDDPIDLELELALQAWWRRFRRVTSLGCWLYIAVGLWMLYGPWA